MKSARSQHQIDGGCAAQDQTPRKHDGQWTSTGLISRSQPCLDDVLHDPHIPTTPQKAVTRFVHTNAALPFLRFCWYGLDFLGPVTPTTGLAVLAELAGWAGGRRYTSTTHTRAAHPAQPSFIFSAVPQHPRHARRIPVRRLWHVSRKPGALPCPTLPYPPPNLSHKACPNVCVCVSPRLFSAPGRNRVGQAWATRAAATPHAALDGASVVTRACRKGVNG